MCSTLYFHYWFFSLVLTIVGLIVECCYHSHFCPPVYFVVIVDRWRQPFLQDKLFHDGTVATCAIFATKSGPRFSLLHTNIWLIYEMSHKISLVIPVNFLSIKGRHAPSVLPLSLTPEFSCKIDTLKYNKHDSSPIHQSTNPSPNPTPRQRPNILFGLCSK